jgi:hypothetical protein
VLRILLTLAALACCGSPAFSETLNSFRHAHGLPALQRNGSLQALAHRHAQSMAMRRTIDHSGFYTERGKAGARAENVAAGCTSESCAIALWAGILRPSPKHAAARRPQIRIGVVRGLLVPGSRPIVQIDSNSFASDAQKPHRATIL